MHISARELSKRLADQAESVCRLLLPGGKAARGEWLAGDITGTEGESLKVNLTGANAGKWRDWANQEMHGDMLDLWRFARDVQLPDAIRQVREHLGILDPFQRETKTYVMPSTNGTHPLDAKGKAMQFLVHDRHLEPAVINRYRVVGQAERSAIVFPCFDLQDRLINRSYRSLPKDGDKKRVWQDTGCAPCLFGWHALPKEAFETRTILLCEGQIDCMTWAQWGIPALSVPNGSGQAWIDYEWENLAAFDHIRLSFDMDGAGKEMGERAMARLGRHRCLVVSIPKKDANDCLQAGHTSEEAKKWVEGASPPRIDGLIAAKDMRQRLLAELAPRPPAFTLPFFSREWPHTGLYFRDAEVTIWSGHPGQGKSTLLRFLTMTVMAAGRTVFYASMESRVERELMKMLILQTGNRATADKVDPFLSEIGENLIFADTLGFISRKVLMEMLWFSFQRHGATHFVIDSLMRVQDLEEDYPAQGEFLNELQDFAKNTGTHIHLVAHPRKTVDGNKPAKMDLKGSSGIFAATDNMVVISRNPRKDALRKDGKPPSEWGDMHDTEVTVEKQRDSGWEGTFFLRFDTRTYCYSKCEPPAQQQKATRKSRQPYNEE